MSEEFKKEEINGEAAEETKAAEHTEEVKAEQSAAETEKPQETAEAPKAEEKKTTTYSWVNPKISGKTGDYLNHMVKEDWKKIRVGGHSKGGNLSVYASVKCDRNIQKRIVKVYSNDGPGFSEEMIQSKEYQRMLPKIKTILPESSIVGMLLEHQEKFEVVKSSQSGIQQHDAMSWEVLGSHFVYVEEVAPQSILLDETMKKWIFQLTKEQREEIVDTVFSMLDDAKIYTVDDFYNSKWKKVQELMKAKSRLSPETQELFSQALRMLWKTGNQTVKKSVKQAVLEKVEEANSLFSTDKSKKSMKSSKK